MNRMNHRLSASTHNLRSLAALVLLLATLVGMSPSVAEASQDQTSTVFIFTKERGQIVYDACYVLVDARDVACDENGNGYVFFSQVPSGTYTVRQVADLGPNRHVEDFTIEVTGVGDPGAPYPGIEMFSTEIVSTSGDSTGSVSPGTSGSPGAPEASDTPSLMDLDPSSGSVDVALITRDPDDGHLLSGACYELVGAGHAVCDVNGDGQVTFAAIPFGTYTVHQTQTPDGYHTINDYDITVEPTRGLPGSDPWEIPLGFVVKQAPDQNAPDTRNVSVVIFDTRNNMRDNSGVCVELIGATDVVCDVDVANGQIDFLDVPAGTWDICPSNFAEGWEWARASGPTSVTVDASPGAPANQMVILVERHIPSTESPHDTTCGSAAVTPDGGGTASGAPTPAGPSASIEVAASTDPLSLLPSIADVPGGLVETGRHTRPLPEVVANYTGPAETTQLFTAWGWQGNAVASFALPSGQQAQSGQVNGVYVSIHQFRDADAARAALDFSIAEQAAGTVLQEITTQPLGEYTRALFGPESYGNETTVLVQQGNVLIRVSAAMLDGDPTGDAVAVAEAILLKIPTQQTTTIDQDTSGTTGSAITADSGTSSGTGGLTVQFWDVRNNVPDNTTQCVQLVGATEVLCAIDFPDGQIQLNGIPAGTYEVCVTRFYPDVQGGPVWAWFRSPASVTIAPGSHETLTLSLYLDFEPGERTLCGFDATTSDSNGNASSDTSSSVTAPDSSGSATTPDSGNSTEATLLMTFRGCPEGFDPAIGDFWAECTIPLDAPDAAFLYWGGDGQGGMNIWELDREYNGEYVHNAKSATMNLRITGLAPVVRDDYQVFGADGADGDAYTVNLVDGETREVYVFYWFT